MSVGSAPRRLWRVLIVDDDADLRDAVSDALEPHGYRVTTAANGHEALSCLRSQHIDVVILDLFMPDMDGWAFRERQKIDPSIASIPVVVFTGAKSKTIDAELLLSKPINLPTLVNELQTLLERRGASSGERETPQ